MAMEVISSTKSYGGFQNVYKHYSQKCACDMIFAIYFPPQSANKPVPLLWYLSGLTCTHENAMTKAGLQKEAARLGIAIVYPDTSPRGEDVADNSDYDLGQGAGFYVNAIKEPWRANYQMYDYIVEELPQLIQQEFSEKIDDNRQGITGHSMGGHGAICIALKNPQNFLSLSAFAPIANPTQSDWGKKQFSQYLGNDEALWRQYDASLLIQDLGWDKDILIDQGTNDNFLDLLRPEALSQALVSEKISSTFRLQNGYDHSYFFVSTFAKDHLEWHAERLLGL